MATTLNPPSRPRARVSVPFLEPDDNGAAVSQTPAAGGAQYTILAGAYVSSFTEAVIPAVISTGLAIRVTSDAAETNNITITGKLGTVVVSETLALPSSTTADTTQLFDRITGISLDGASTGNIKVGTVADDDGIITSAMLLSGDQLTTGVYKSGIPVFSTSNHVARRVLITCVGDESARTFTVIGTNRFGNGITETITGVNATTVSSLLDFQTILSVSVDNDTAGAVEIGTGNTVSSRWWVADYSNSSEKTTLAAVLDEENIATAYNYSVECIYNYDYKNEDNQYADIHKIPMNEKDKFNTEFDINDAHSVATIKNHVAAIRITMNSYTSSYPNTKQLNLDIIPLLGGIR